VRETVVDAFAHQDLPFDRVVEALRPPRDAGPQPFFQIVFALENLPARADSPEQLTIETATAATEIAKYDLVLWVRDSPDGLTGSLGYRTQLFDAATMQRLSRGYLGMLAAAVAEPDVPIDQLDYRAADNEIAAEAARKREAASAQRLKNIKPRAQRGKK
jgi:non-ribosomal peptide synthetase component F